MNATLFSQSASCQTPAVLSWSVSSRGGRLHNVQPFSALLTDTEKKRQQREGEREGGDQPWISLGPDEMNNTGGPKQANTTEVFVTLFLSPLFLHLFRWFGVTMRTRSNYHCRYQKVYCVSQHSEHAGDSGHSRCRRSFRHQRDWHLLLCASRTRRSTDRAIKSELCSAADVNVSDQSETNFMRVAYSGPCDCNLP